MTEFSRLVPGPGDKSHANISAWAIRNPVPTSLLFVLLTIAGLFCFPFLRVNNTPDIDPPQISVTVTEAGAAPAELETQVTRRVEDAVAGLGDVKHITSIVSDGVSTTNIEFNLGKNLDRAAEDVRNNVSQIRSQLPADVNEPVITRAEASGGAILTFVAHADRMSEEETSWFVDDTVSKALLSIPGVAQVNRVGGVDREIRISLHPDRLVALGTTAAEVNGQLRDLNINRPGGRGTLGAGEQAIRTLGYAQTVDDLKDRTIELSGGRTVRLRELGDITDATGEVRTGARLNGKPVVAFEILRTRGSSELAVADKVRRKITELAADEHADLTEVSSTTAFVLSSYDGAKDAMAVGAFLAILVVWAFLRDVRATLITALAMPASLIPTFMVMRIVDYSLSGISLLGLTLVVGVLVDDAIVEIENIVRHRREGTRTVYQAALEASTEIGLAVMATTATIVAVFLPVSVMPGIPGQFFRQFALCVVTAVLFSLLVARLLTPLMSAYLLRPRPPTPEPPPGFVMRHYLGLLAWSLRHRLFTLSGGIAFFALSLCLIPFISTDLVPAADRSRSVLTLQLAPGSTLAETDAAIGQVNRILHTHPEVVSVFASLGTASGGGPLNNTTQKGDPRTANVIINLVPRGQRVLSQQAFEAIARPELETLPGVRVSFGDGDFGSKVSMTLVGDDPTQLDQAARTLERQMRGIPELSSARSTASLSRPELQIIPRIDRAAELGVSVATIGTTAELATLGAIDAELAKFNLPNRQVPIRVMIDESGRSNLDVLRTLRVVGDNGKKVPLEAVADITFGSGPVQVERLDRRRKATVEAELGGLPLGKANELIAALPIMHSLPEGVYPRQTGDQETQGELFTGFAAAIISGILLVYAVLVVLFRSFVLPLTVMTALPLSLGGALLLLLLSGKALGLSAIIGILMLMGIVAKNSILLVEYAVMARARGLSRVAALMTAAEKRARPIIMTTIAMTAGMVHIALGFGADSEFRAPMATCVIGGLITSTLLSLIFVPIAFTYMDDLEIWLGRRLRGILTSGPDHVVAELPQARRGAAAE